VKHLHTGFYIDNELHHAISDINLTVNEGEVISIVGESGCGKSVLSLSIMQLLPKLISEISEGEIKFENKDLVQLNTKEMSNIRGKDISMIFQETMTALTPVFTIGSHMIEVFRNHQNMSKKNALDRSVELLSQVGISRPETLIHDYPHQLSGGMRQREIIAIEINLNLILLNDDDTNTSFSFYMNTLIHSKI